MDTTENLTNAAPGPFRPRRVGTILVGVDGSPESIRSAAFAGSLGAQIGARIIAAHATGLLDVWPEHPEHGGERNSHAHVAAMMDGEWTSPIRTEGVQPQIVLRDGPPAQVLLALADELDVDLIIVGSRGVGLSDPYGLGSVATKVAQHSSRPVIVVPGAGRTQPGASVEDSP